MVGHGDNNLLDGAWRTLNVLIGIAIALLFSFALPLYATYSWRYRLADALRECARAYASLGQAGAPTGAYRSQHLGKLNTLLVQLRSLMPSVSKEIDVPLERLENIQRSLRICISTLELLNATRGPSGEPAADVLSRVGDRRIRDALIGMSRALRFGTVARLAHPRVVNTGAVNQLAGTPTVESALALGFSNEIEQLRGQLLAACRHPARPEVAFTTVLLFLFLLIRALQHAQDFPPVQVNQHALQRGQHVRANRIQKPGLIFGGLVLDVELVFPAQRLGLELAMQLQARLRAAQKISAAQGALQIVAFGFKAHRARPEGGCCAMRVRRERAGQCPRGMGTAWVG